MRGGHQLSSPTIAGKRIHMGAIQDNKALEGIRNGPHIRIDVFDCELGSFRVCPSKLDRWLEWIDDECREIPCRDCTGIDRNSIESDSRSPGFRDRMAVNDHV